MSSTSNRDNFKKGTIDALSKRVAYLCSNPSCKRPTIGANHLDIKATSIGIAAHITAASAGGPRYNSNLTKEERIDINNAIWLCSNCATLIDKDEENYSVELLKEWKTKAENESISRLKGQLHNIENKAPYLECDLIYTNGGRYVKYISDKNPKKVINGISSYVPKGSPIYHWEVEWKYEFIIYNNSRYPAYNLSINSLGKEHFTFLEKLNNINNIQPFDNVILKAKYSISFEGKGAEATEIMKKKIPKQLKYLNLEVTYLDDERKSHTTLLKIENEELINIKASR